MNQKKNNPAIVGITLDNDGLLCTRMRHADVQNNDCVVAKTELSHPILIHDYLFDIDGIANGVRNCLEAMQLTTPYYIVFGISNATDECIVTKQALAPLLQTAHDPASSASHLIWYYQPLTADHDDYYYVCALSREQLFQYYLLAHQAAIHCIGVVPRWWGLWCAFNSAQQRSQLTMNTEWEQLRILMQEWVQNQSGWPSNNDAHANNSVDQQTMMIHKGLSLVGKQIYEQS